MQARWQATKSCLAARRSRKFLTDGAIPMKTMDIVDPVPLKLNDAHMLRIVREITADISRVFVSEHAKRRLRERSITGAQVYACLRNGQISEHAHEAIGGDWKCTLAHRQAGDEMFDHIVRARYLASGRKYPDQGNDRSTDRA